MMLRFFSSRPAVALASVACLVGCGSSSGGTAGGGGSIALTLDATSATVPQGQSTTNVKKYAKQQLDEALAGVLAFNFNSLLIPLFEGGDCVSVQTKNFATKFPLNAFSLPLVSSTQMSVGAVDVRSHSGRLRTYQRHE